MVKSRLGWTRLTRIIHVNDEVETFQDVEIKPWQGSKAKKTSQVCDFPRGDWGHDEWLYFIWWVNLSPRILFILSHVGELKCISRFLKRPNSLGLIWTNYFNAVRWSFYSDFSLLVFRDDGMRKGLLDDWPLCGPGRDSVDVV